MTLSSDADLTDEELDRLADFLDTIGPRAMNIESLDGFFAALICGPEMVMPSEYLPEVWGEGFSFEDDAQASDMLDLMMRHWNAIAGELLRTLNEPHVYLPVLLESTPGCTPGNDWALGFMRGVQLRPLGWRELIDSDEHGGAVLPLMMLAHEHDPDPALRPPPITPDKREELLQAMIAGLTRIYRYFEPRRRSLAHAPLNTPMRRAAPKVGRNEPCPCGSGRKYKHCCASNAPTMH